MFRKFCKYINKRFILNFKVTANSSWAWLRKLSKIATLFWNVCILLELFILFKSLIMLLISEIVFYIH